MAMEVSSNYSSYTNAYTNVTESRKRETGKAEESKAPKTVDTGSTDRKTAADELAYLSRKYSNYTFVSANYTFGMRYGSNATTNVAIAPQFLAKMAKDPELEKKYEKSLEFMREFDERKFRRKAAEGMRIVARGYVIDKDGGISSWTISESTNKRHYGQEMLDYANKIRRERLEKKREEAKMEAKHQADREEMEKWKEKLDEAGREQFGDKWKGAVVIFREEENHVVSIADKDNVEVKGLNMDIKA